MRRTSELSPFGELASTLVRAEATHRGIRPGSAEYRQLVRRRSEPVIAALTEARETVKQRREGVLKHPDCAQQIADALDLTSPAHWNGYLPPGFDPEQEKDGRPVPARLNNSPVRAALVDIATDAWKREQVGQ
ncbi:MAG TPA: hypothetical protein VF444_03440 [Pseudonocardiaceae bacterium]